MWESLNLISNQISENIRAFCVSDTYQVAQHKIDICFRIAKFRLIVR